MTREQKDKILKAIAEDRNDYAKDCNRRIERENGKIEGADYMLQRFLDVLRTEAKPQAESEDKDGKKIYTTDVVVESTEFAESKNSAQQAPAEPTADKSEGFMNIPDGVDDEGLPFN